jgi:alpha-L-rhamnosidase
LSWRIEADGRDVSQVSFRIRAAASEDALTRDDSLLWDCGVVESSRTLDIAYNGSALTSMQQIWWDVEICDNRGRTVRSAAAVFETGLLSPDDWHGKWIVAEDRLAEADRHAGLMWIWSEQALDARLHGFRIDFTAPSDLTHAEVLVSGKDELAGAWVNGHSATILELPYWGSLHPIDIPLNPGRNSLCIAASAEQEGFYPPSGGAVAALIRMHRADGTITRVVSNNRWKVMPDPPEGWHAADFDVSRWEDAQLSGARAICDPRPGEPAMLLRTEFTAKQDVIAARLFATALGMYEGRINGEVISDTVLAPELSVADAHVLYQSYDVTDLVQTGSNALGFTVADGFYAGAFSWTMERYSLGPAPRRLLAQLRLDYADGSVEWVTTDRNWRTTESAILAADIYGGEARDARLEHDEWDNAGFDDSDWREADEGEAPTTALVAQTSPPLRQDRVLRAISVSEPVPGRFVFDFGQNFSGWARLRVKGESGTKVTMRFAEILRREGIVDQSNLRRADATDTFFLRGDPSGETFEPSFTYHGFRYVEVTGFPGIPTPDDLEAIVVFSDCDETGTMEFDNPLLQKIWQNALWSQRSNFFAVPTDCPQRDERLGWMGDIQVFLDAAAFNMDVDAFIRRYLREVRAAQFDNGGYPIVLPAPRSFPEVVTAGWSEAGVILPHGLWQRYGDTPAIEENWDAMERWMGYVARNNPDYIWRNDRGLDLGDWLSVDARLPDDETTPRILCATAYWALCARMMAEMADATGRIEAATRHRELFEKIKLAFGGELITLDGVAGNGSQTSQVLALYMDLVPDELRRSAAGVLANEIAGRGMKLSTGFLGTPYLLDVLADEGELTTVRDLLLQTECPSWGYMPSAGATTMWERWNSDVGDAAMNSHNHYAFGAVIGFFYRRLAGIAPAAPGFRRIAVRPIWFPEVGKVAASYDSCVGRIASEVEGDEAGLASLRLTIPPNSVAEVELPADFDWHEEGRPIADCDGVHSCRTEDGQLRVEVGSGAYHFER